MIGYFDSSALVKLVVEEPGSGQAGALWNGADAVLSSRVAHAEVRAAMAAARRAGRLTASQLGDAKDAWATVWDALRVVEVSLDVGALTGELAEEHALSGFDAIHLASAAQLAVDGVVVATWDTRLHAGACELDLATLPATL